MANSDSTIPTNLSYAWANAILALSRQPRREFGPLVVSIDVSTGVNEEPGIREILDVALASCEQHSVRTVASTIFPVSLWNPDQPASDLYDRYERIWPKLRRVRANANGTYFRRMTAYQSGNDVINQLEHVVSTWNRGNHRRSALQLAIFDPAHDHTHQRQRGFPCLHQVAVVPNHDGTISLTGFYGLQLLFEKAYGNYLGLAHLGDFLASQLDMRLRTVTCIASVAKYSQTTKLKKKERDSLEAELIKMLEAASK